MNSNQCCMRKKHKRKCENITFTNHSRKSTHLIKLTRSLAVPLMFSCYYWQFFGETRSFHTWCHSSAVLLFFFSPLRYQLFCIFLLVCLSSSHRNNRQNSPKWQHWNRNISNSWISSAKPQHDPSTCSFRKQAEQLQWCTLNHNLIIWHHICSKFKRQLWFKI